MFGGDVLAMRGRALLEGWHDNSAGANFAYLVLCACLVCFAGLMSGLTLGLMSMDLVELEVLRRSGSELEARQAARIIPVVSNAHFLLVTLLLCNAIAMEALPIFLNKLMTEVVAILVSVTAVLFAGEIVPQAVCSKYGLAIGSVMALPVRCLMLLTSPISFPIAKLLDWVLGGEHSSLFRRKQLKALVTLHARDEGFGGRLTADEIQIITGALDLTRKTAYHAMTPLDKVFMLSLEQRLDDATISAVMAAKPFSRLPVYRGTNKQDIMGVILVKELLEYVKQFPDSTVASMKVRQLPRLAADTPMYDLLKLFRVGRAHMALLTQPLPRASSDGGSSHVRDCSQWGCAHDPHGAPDMVEAGGALHGRGLARHSHRHQPHAALPTVQELGPHSQPAAVTCVELQQQGGQPAAGKLHPSESQTALLGGMHITSSGGLHGAGSMRVASSGGLQSLAANIKGYWGRGSSTFQGGAGHADGGEDEDLEKQPMLGSANQEPVRGTHDSGMPVGSHDAQHSSHGARGGTMQPSAFAKQASLPFASTNTGLHQQAAGRSLQGHSSSSSAAGCQQACRQGATEAEQGCSVPADRAVQGRLSGPWSREQPPAATRARSLASLRSLFGKDKDKGGDAAGLEGGAQPTGNSDDRSAKDGKRRWRQKKKRKGGSKTSRTIPAASDPQGQPMPAAERNKSSSSGSTSSTSSSSTGGSSRDDLEDMLPVPLIAAPGEPIGIITIEDVIEELMGLEILDETDKYMDNEQSIPVSNAGLEADLPKHLRTVLAVAERAKNQVLAPHAAGPSSAPATAPSHPAPSGLRDLASSFFRHAFGLASAGSLRASPPSVAGMPAGLPASSPTAVPPASVITPLSKWSLKAAGGAHDSFVHRQGSSKLLGAVPGRAEIHSAAVAAAARGGLPPRQTSYANWKMKERSNTQVQVVCSGPGAGAPVGGVTHSSKSGRLRGPRERALLVSSVGAAAGSLAATPAGSAAVAAGDGGSAAGGDAAGVAAAGAVQPPVPSLGDVL